MATSRYNLLAALLFVGSVSAWSDSNPSLASEYTFTQNISLDPDDDGPQQPEAPSKTVLCASSLLYDDGEFLVTSQAMMINGGDLTPPSAFGDYSDFDDSDEDDDNDDDNDGHSSMLSNSSLRRSLASANGSSSYDRSKSQKSSCVVPTSMETSPPASSRTKRAFGL